MNEVLCQPPRTTATPPKFRAPAGACDCHSHIFGPAEKYPFVKDRSFTPPDASCESYDAILKALGCDRAVIVQASVYGSDNSRLTDAIAEMGADRVRGVAMIEATASEQHIQGLHDAGIRAARFITTARGGPRVDQLPEIAARVAPFGWHLEAYMPSREWVDLLPVLAGIPVPMVFDHLGGVPADAGADDPVVKGILDLVDKDKAWIKLTGYRNSSAGFPYADVAGLARTFVDRAAHRCVWGSDWPHTAVEGRMVDDGQLFDLLADWAPDPSVRKRILVDNPAELYDFAPL
ncbi:amidohydrolase family protein [Microbaculum marinum]|uniref:Amidohydrolase family protein n=1 Tax=Microbaculum marinum TaxID=1764581 RepID=A0AAW9RW94_9HYPH